MAFVRWNEVTAIWEKADDPNVVPPTWNHLVIDNPTLPNDTANKAYVDLKVAGINLSNYVPYTGANQAVNFNTQQLTAGAGAFSGKILSQGGAGLAYWQANIEIYYDNHPRIAFHWPGVVASQIGMDSSGWIRTYNNPGNGYASFAAGHITANGDIDAVAGYLKARDYLQTGGVVYPGRTDIAGPAPQLSWYLGSNANYGLITNTSLYLVGAIYPQAGMPANYIVGEAGPADFTPSGLSGFTIDAAYGAIWMVHNRWLFVTWMWQCTFQGSTLLSFTIPGGYICQRYAQAAPVLLPDMIQLSLGARIEVAPGSTSINCYSGQPSSSTGRYGGQIQIYIG